MEMITQLHLLESLKKNKLETAIEENGKTLSYAKLLERANQVSRFLMDQDLPEKSVVAIRLDCISDMVAVMIGIMNVRMVFTAIDGSLPKKRLSDMIDDLNPSCIITSTKSKQVHNRVEKTFFLWNIYETAIKTEINYPEFDLNDDLYIYFTSGSTGVPKGIIGRNSSLIHFLKWEVDEFKVQKSARFSQFISPYFDAFLRDVFAPLLGGATICVPPKENSFFTSEHIIPWIDENRISVIHCVPSIFKLFIDKNVIADNFGALEHILLSGEKLNPAGLKDWYRIFGQRIQLVNLYGTTETTMIRTMYRIRPKDVYEAKISIGNPIPDTRIIIANEDFEECNKLIVGDLYIVSKYVSKGYLNSPELTSQKFRIVDLGTKKESIAFNTGDRGRKLADGRIELLGRADRQVKIRGIRVELDEIEIALAKSKYISDSVVMLDDEIEDAILAFVISKEVIDAEKFKELIHDELAAYLPQFMIPSQLFVVDAFPLMRNGKIDKKAIFKLRVQKELILPSNDEESRLLGLWQDVLARDEISVDDSFIEVGGNSLNTMRLIAIIFAEFEIRISLSELFSNLTIQKQANLIKKKGIILQQSTKDGIVKHQD